MTVIWGEVLYGSYSVSFTRQSSRCNRIRWEAEVLTEGQQPRPGEVVVTSTDVGPLDLNVQLTQEQGSKDVTDDVLQIISAIEQGQDPSVDEEFAPAAGENGGSSLQTSATIVRDGTELLASTSFETIGIESLGLSQTQVLALNDLFRSNLQTSADSTDKPWQQRQLL